MTTTREEYDELNGVAAPLGPLDIIPAGVGAGLVGAGIKGGSKAFFAILSALGLHAIAVQQSGEIPEGVAISSRDIADEVAAGRMTPDEGIKRINDLAGTAEVGKFIVQTGRFNPVSRFTGIETGAAGKVEGAAKAVELQRTRAGLGKQQFGKTPEEAAAQSFTSGEQFEKGQQSAQRESGQEQGAFFRQRIFEITGEPANIDTIKKLRFQTTDVGESILADKALEAEYVNQKRQEITDQVLEEVLSEPVSRTPAQIRELINKRLREGL